MMRLYPLAALALLAGAAAAQPALFTPVPGADLAPRQADLLAALAAQPAFVTADLGLADAGVLLAASDVTVAIPGDVAVVIPVDRVERRGPGDASWFGQSADGTTSGLFVVREGMVTGTVRTGGRLYALRPLTGGLHALARLDEGAFRDHGDDYDAFRAAERERLAREPAPPASDVEAGASVTATYTVLVPYTAAVRAASADVRALVQLAVDETNQAYLNSGITTRAALAHTYETPTVEGGYSADLAALRDVGDGRFDEAHALRDAYAADAVALIANFTGACGIGYLHATAANAFTVTEDGCATGNYTFGHEIGHNLGAHHDPGAPATNTVYPYGHGYVDTVARWRTVMAYNTVCAPGVCTRLQRFSSRSVLHNGLPTGTAATHDNARVINDRGPAVASFRSTAVTLADGAGWRMLAAPVEGMTVADLAARNLVQGVPGYYPDAAPNLFTGFDGGAWTTPSGGTDVLAAGRGLLWYFFDQTFDPGGPSQSYDLPRPLAPPPILAAPGADVAVPLTPTMWTLLGNPFATGLDVSGMAGWATGGALASAVGQVWDPTRGGSYELTTTAGHTVAAWQGFFVENNTATGLTLPAAARVTAGALQGRADTRLVAFELEGTAAATGQPVLDRAIVLYFHPDGTDGWDLWDASKLRPLSSSYATLAFEGTRDGGPILKAQESRPLTPADTFSVPLAFEAVGTTTAFTLRWPTLANVPAAWTITLRDVVTGAVVDLRAAQSYTFTATPAAAPPPPAAPSLPADPAAPLAGATRRFVLHLAPGTTTAGDGAASPLAFALAEPAPNPTAGAVALRYEVPEAAAVRVEVLDLLGRRVAMLVDGPVAAGHHAAHWDAAGAAGGVYVVRMTAGAFAQTRRVTVVR